MSSSTIGVGIIGSGSVVQGIHLPTLARLTELFTIRHVMDIDADAARTVAERVGARSSTAVQDLLEDPLVEVVAVCSPHPLHAEHVIAACRAGVAVVLCEKPLATTSEEAEEMATAARASGTRIVVGAMHAFDPAWTFAEAHWGDLPDTAVVIRSSIVLPFNDRYEAWATEVARPARIPQRDTSTPGARVAVITARILGLGIHDIPLVRALLPDWRDVTVESARLLDPAGYAVTLRSPSRSVQLTGSFREHWHPEWEFEAVGPDAVLHIDFPPSYVQAGAATATITRAEGAVGSPATAENGYQREWRHVAELLRDPETTTRDDRDLVDDLAFALAVAELAGEHLRSAPDEPSARADGSDREGDPR